MSNITDKLQKWYDRRSVETHAFFEPIINTSKILSDLFIPKNGQVAAEMYAPFYSDIKAGADVLDSGVNEIKRGNYLNGIAMSAVSPIIALTSLAVPDGLDKPLKYQTRALVKYYGPTMGKTTAAKSNSNLIDFDDIVREPIKELANKKGISTKDLKIRGDLDYKNLLLKVIEEWKSKPENKGKTLMVSNKILSLLPIFDNIPSIPDKQTFIQRHVKRGSSNAEYASQYYDDLLRFNPRLRIENRFVSDLERAPKYIAKKDGNYINIFSDLNKKVGYVQLEPVGNDLGISYIKRLEKLDKGDLFQQIGLEAARQYGDAIGKKVITARKLLQPKTQVPAISNGFKTKPITPKLRSIFDVPIEEAISNPKIMEDSRRSKFIANAIDSKIPLDEIRLPEQLIEELKIPIDYEGYGNSIPIYSLPEIYNTKGIYVSKLLDKSFPNERDSEAIWRLLPEEDSWYPGFYASYIEKPKKNMQIKFRFKSGGQLNYLNYFK